MSKFEKKIIEKENERLSKTKEKVIDLSYFVDEKKLKKMKSKSKNNSEEFNPMTFKINPKEVEKLNKWMGNIIGVYGKYGNFEYTFKPTGGLGWDIWVYSDLAKTEICLTEDVDY
jgi:hypothetical protein